MWKANTLKLLSPNVKYVKTLWNNSRCKYQLKQITTTREKILPPIKSTFLEKSAENFKRVTSTFYAK